jgi:hypothetical protein
LAAAVGGAGAEAACVAGAGVAEGAGLPAAPFFFVTAGPGRTTGAGCAEVAAGCTSTGLESTAFGGSTA